MLERQILNKINQVTLALQGQTEETFYTAYLLNELSVQTQNQYNDLSLIPDNPTFTIVMNVAFGMVPAFSMDRRWAYKGASPTSLQLNTRLRLENDVQTDFVDKLERLAYMALPIEATYDGSEKKSVGSFYDRAATYINSVGESAGGVVETAASWIAKGMQTVYLKLTGRDPDGNNLGNARTQSIADSMFNDTYALDLPLQNRVEGSRGIYVYYGNPDGVCSLKLGPYLIQSLSYRIPKLTMSGGYPDHLNVDIGLTSYRTTTADNFMPQFFRMGAEGAERITPSEVGGAS